MAIVRQFTIGSVKVAICDDAYINTTTQEQAARRKYVSQVLYGMMEQHPEVVDRLRQAGELIESTVTDNALLTMSPSL